MSFDIGELVGEVRVDASSLDPTIAAALNTLTTWGTRGRAAATSAGQETGQAYSRGLGGSVDVGDAERAVRSGLEDAGSTARVAGQGAGDLYSRALANGVDLGDVQQRVRAGMSDTERAAQQAGTGAGEAFSRATTSATDLTGVDQRVRAGLADAESTGTRAGRATGEAFGDGAADGADGAGDSILDRLSGLMQDGPALGFAVGAALGVALMASLNAAIETDTVTREIASGLGQTVEEAGRYGRLAGELFSANYGESMSEVGAAIVAVKKNFTAVGNVSDATFKAITGQVISLSGRFEEEFSAITRSADTLFKTGLARNAQEALDIVAAGFQSNVNAADDLLDTFDEYSTVFRSLGLEGADVLGILSQGLKAGSRDADVVADAFKEMLLIFQSGDSRSAIEGLGLNFDALTLSMSKGGESAKTATDLIVDAVNGVEDPATRAATAVEIFGTKAEDLQGALAGIDVDTAASEFEAAYGKIAGSAADLDGVLGGGLAATAATLGRQLGDFARQAGQDLAPVLDAAATAAGILFGVLKGGYDIVTSLPGEVYLLGAAVAIWASWGGIAVGARALAGAVVALGGAARAALVSLGPIGAVMLAAGTAMAFLMDQSDDLAEVTQDIATYYDGLQATLDSTTGAITEQTEAMIRKTAVDNGQAAALADAGISLDLYTDAALGNVDAQNELARQVKAAQDAALGAGDAYSSMGSILDGAGVSQEAFMEALRTGDLTDITNQVQAYADRQGELTGNVQTASDVMSAFRDGVDQTGAPLTTLDNVLGLVGQTSGELATAQADVMATTGGVADSATAAYDRLLAYATATGASRDEIQRQGEAAGLSAEAIDRISAATDGAVKATDPLVEALKDGSSNADDMASAIDDLKLALDILTGGAADAAAATREYDAQVRAVVASGREQAQAAADLTDAQKTLADMQATGTATAAELESAQRDVADAQDGVADSASSTQDELDGLAEAAKGMTARAFEGAGGMGNYENAVGKARAEMSRQRQAFIDSAQAAGVGRDAAERLADAQGLIPDNVRTSYDALRVADAVGGANQVTSAANNVPTQKTIRFDTAGNAIETIGNIERRVNALTGKTLYIDTVERTTRAATNAQGVVATYAEGGEVTGRGARGHHVAALVGIGEHMLDDEDVDRFHGHANIYGLRDVLERRGMGAAGQYLLNLAGQYAGNQPKGSPSVAPVTVPSGGGSSRLAESITINQVGGDIVGGIDRAAQIARAGRYGS